MAQSFNSLEKNIARVLSSFPGLKRTVKKVYTRVIYLYKKKNYTNRSISELIEISDGMRESFFGYYDKFPDNGNGLVLVHISADSTKVLPRNVKQIYLNVFCMKVQKFILKDEIKLHAFNWQQGARAHWLNENSFVYNDYDNINDSYVTKVFSMDTQSPVDTLYFPVQDSYKDDFYLSLNYKKLSKFRPDYGYFNHKKEVDISECDDGIWKVAYADKKQSQIITMNSILNFNYSKEHDDYDHKVNHIMISPDGKYFIFMHRSYSKSGQRFDRLLLSNHEGELLKVIADNEMISHCFWYDDSTILGYLRHPDGTDGYWLIDIKTNEYKSFNQGRLSKYGDGHPSVNNEYIITDTYPDKSRMQSLLLTKKDDDNSVTLGEFFHGFNFVDETRCDLHPRFSSCSNFVFFDSVFTGNRKLYYMDITKAKKEL